MYSAAWAPPQASLEGRSELHQSGTLMERTGTNFLAEVRIACPPRTGMTWVLAVPELITSPSAVVADEAGSEAVFWWKEKRESIP